MEDQPKMSNSNANEARSAEEGWSSTELLEITDTLPINAHLERVFTRTLPPEENAIFTGDDKVLHEPFQNRLGQLNLRTSMSNELKPKCVLRSITSSIQFCSICSKNVNCVYKIMVGDKVIFLCNEACIQQYKSSSKHLIVRDNLKLPMSCIPLMKCTRCNLLINPSGLNWVSWQTYAFCNQICLVLHQNLTGNICHRCRKPIPRNIIGKYSVCFGFHVRAFCQLACLEAFVKDYRNCYLCQKVIYRGDELFLGPLSGGYKVKNFCSNQCVSDYEAILRNGEMEVKITTCHVCDKVKVILIEALFGDITANLCSEVCFSAFKFVNEFRNAAQCENCKKYFSFDQDFSPRIFTLDSVYVFCSKICWKLHVLSSRCVVRCTSCKLTKHNYDMITKWSMPNHAFCTVKCLKRIMSCTFCNKMEIPIRALRDLHGNVKYFCSVSCLDSYRKNPPKALQNLESAHDVQPSAVASCGDLGGVKNLSKLQEQADKNIQDKNIYEHVQLLEMLAPLQVANIGVGTKLSLEDKATSTNDLQMNTEKNVKFVPVPIPVFIPVPTVAYKLPLPIPWPVPVPLVTPLTGNATKNTLGERQNSEEKLTSRLGQSPQSDSPESFSEEVISQALDKDGASLKASSELEELVDSSKTISTDDVEDVLQKALNMSSSETRKSLKRVKKLSDKSQDPKKPMENMSASPKPEDLCPEEPKLKYTFGVNAWVHWVWTKKTEIEESKSSPLDFLKTDILSLSNKELDRGLEMFVKEVRKPSGDEFQPDALFYMCLGLQYYLRTNGRKENIFFDSPFESFIKAFGHVIEKFNSKGVASRNIKVRVEEVHLWESHLFGPVSPYTILNTMMFYFTKLFNLKTLEDHRKISFSNFVVRPKSDNGAALQFHTPPSLLGDGSGRRKVYEIEEVADVQRCPVNYFKFYLSRCPESVKLRNDVFYLLPVKGCLPHSSFWYSASPVPDDVLTHMLNRLNMIK